MNDNAQASAATSEAEESKSAEALRLSVETADDYAIFTTDAEGLITDWNIGVQRMLGYGRDEFIGQPGTIIFTAEERAAGAPEEELETARTHGHALDNRWHVRCDGSLFFARGVMTALYDADGKVRGFTKILHNVTSQIVAEAERDQLLEHERAEHRRTEEILESISDAFYAVDSEFRFTYINRKAEEWWGRKREELIGRHYWTEFPKAIVSELYLMHQKVMAERRPVQFETLSPIINRWIDVSIYPEAEGGLTCYFQDITERRRVEAQRAEVLRLEQEARNLAEQAQHLAEEANRLKDEFISVISHELRTPLNIVLGWVSMLRQRVLDGQSYDQACETNERNAQMQSRLINDLLDISRINEKTLEVHLEPTEIVPILATTIDAVRLSAAEGLNIYLLHRADVDVIPADPDRLQQIISNLLTNAIKFTPSGGEVEVRTCNDSEHYIIQVCDTGIGIEPQFLPYVFDRFRQEDSSSTRRHGGLGLGLFIVRNLVELHGGTISVHSEGKNRGTSFKIMLPLDSQAS
jgi:PAS domain S-box-containing protein